MATLSSTARIMVNLYRGQINAASQTQDAEAILATATAKTSADVHFKAGLVQDARAATARTKMELSHFSQLRQLCEINDQLVNNFKPDDFKNFGMTYKDKNQALSTQIEQLGTTFNELVAEYKGIQAAQKDLRTQYQSAESDTNKVSALTSQTNAFEKRVQSYTDRYTTIRFDLDETNKLISRYVPSSEARDQPAPRLGD